MRQSPFGRYDEAFIKAVQNRWYDLIDERRFAASVTGKVQVTFRLNYDGRITAARVADTKRSSGTSSSSPTSRASSRNVRKPARSRGPKR